VELVGQLDYDFSSIQRLKNDSVNYLLRMREFDRLARAFLVEHPGGVIVDLGCGLDTRFERVDNGYVEWYGLDLPEVIELRKELLDETPRSHFIGCSVLDFSWVDALSGQASKRGQPGWPILFLAEAVLVYLEEADVKRLVQALVERFPGAELVCEAYSPVVIRFHPRPPDMPQPRWGLKDDRDVEGWAPGIRLLSQCTTSTSRNRVWVPSSSCGTCRSSLGQHASCATVLAKWGLGLGSRRASTAPRPYSGWRFAILTEMGGIGT